MSSRNEKQVDIKAKKSRKTSILHGFFKDYNNSNFWV